MKEKRGEHPLGDLGQLILAAVFLIVWVSDTFFFNWSTFLSDIVPRLVRDGLMALAVLTALVLSWKGRAVITGEARPDHVVDTGPFRYVRHPLYLAALLAYVGMAVSSLSLFSFALLIPSFVFYNHLANYEEKLLEARFGEAYREYETRTGKWLPRIWRRG